MHSNGGGGGGGLGLEVSCSGFVHIIIVSPRRRASLSLPLQWNLDRRLSDSSWSASPQSPSSRSASSRSASSRSAGSRRSSEAHESLDCEAYVVKLHEALRTVPLFSGICYIVASSIQESLDVGMNIVLPGVRYTGFTPTLCKSQSE